MQVPVAPPPTEVPPPPPTAPLVADLPNDCSAAGITSSDACEALLRGKYVDPICAAQGITDPAACKTFVYRQVANPVTCVDLNARECASATKDRHLGEILGMDQTITDIKEQITSAATADGTLDLAALAVRGDDTHAKVTELLSIRPSEERVLHAFTSRAQISITGDDTVDGGAAVLIAYDADGDGVPDDVETRNGLDPNNADSDGDGVSDDDELKKLRPKGIDKAIADGRVIGQPISEGRFDGSLTVDVATDATNGGGTFFSGTGRPGAVVTLYVYSELPMIMTTTVDDDGQWSYDMSDPLKEGSHEVYVAINDDTGKVTRKSNPLSILIPEASAATTSEAADAVAEAARAAIAQDAQANAEQGSGSAIASRAYLYASAAFVLVGLLIAVRRYMPGRKQ